MKKLSVTLATYNEEANIGRCLESVVDIADEIVIVDGVSSDLTVNIAEEYGARIISEPNKPNFHINKQMANDAAHGEWILQLDADEVITPALGEEILRVVKMSDNERTAYDATVMEANPLFARQQAQVMQRDGTVGTEDGEVVAYFIPRKNYFLGRYLLYGGVYPDGAIRLFRAADARLPAKHVHELYEVDGRVSWLQEAMLHYDSPTWERYIARNHRYARLFGDELRRSGVKDSWFNLLKYRYFLPLQIFLRLYVRHKGFLDGYPGLVWAWYSGLTWRKAYDYLVASSE